MEHLPRFSITTNDKNVDEALAQRVVKVEVISHSGFISDHCIITINDHPDKRIEPPKTGDRIAINMGYGENLIHHGEFEIAEFSYQGPDETISLYGNKLQWSSELKSPKQKSWQSTPEQPLMLSAMLEEIASAHQLQAKVESSLGQLIIPAIDQSESDLQLITKLAAQYDATAKVAENYLIFASRGTGLSVSGKSLPKVTLNKQQLLNWQMLHSESSNYSSCKAYYYDIHTAKRKVVTVGQGSPCFELTYPYANEQSAKFAANARLRDFSRSTANLKISCIGNEKLFSASTITIDQVRNGIDGDWVTTKVHHQIGHQGFISHIEAEKPS